MDSDAIAAFCKIAREMALRYEALGWSVLPIGMDSKVPCIEWKEYQERRATPDEINRWFDEGVPDGKGGLTKVFNLGIATGKVSDLVVLDCDNEEAVAHAVTTLDLWSLFGVKTTRGQHFYFRHPGSRVKNATGGNGDDWTPQGGVDLRGDGGLVVVPPSLKFDETGAHRHTYTFTFDVDELEEMVSSIPSWPGIRLPSSAVSAQAGPDEFSFENLSLVGVKSYGERAWDQAEERVRQLGRKMRDGDGRNSWLTRYVGECIAQGMTQTETVAAANQFEMEFFVDPLPIAEKASIIRSIISIHRRNHPPDPESPPPNKPRLGLRLITHETVDQLEQIANGPQYLIDPFIPPESIIQVVGFSGHGKTRWLMGMLWAASSGTDFGSAYVHQPIRTLYLDYELAGGLMADRVREYKQLIAPMGAGFAIWSASLSLLSIDLTKPEGIEALASLIKESDPHVVVIDTVRSAWPGMEEKSPHAWVRVNALCKAIRQLGKSAVVVHHRNKPGQNGMGREAGSTNQLTDLDAQVIVTKVVVDREQAGREAALFDAQTEVKDFRGQARTAFGYLQMMAPAGHIVQEVFEISFGKLRQVSESHTTTYVGITKHRTTGDKSVVHSMTPRQKAVAMAEKSHMTETQISAALQVPEPTVKRWLAEKDEKAAAALKRQG